MAATKLAVVPNRLLGVDISNNNGTIDFDALADCGVVWAYIKEGEDRKIQGTPTYDYFVDAFFERNWNECLRVGIIPGVYRFVRPSGTSPAESITRLETHVRAVVGDNGLPSRSFLVCDFEEETNSDNQLQWLSEWDNAARDSQYLAKGNAQAVWNYSSRAFLAQHGCLMIGSTPTQYNYIEAAYAKARPASPPGYIMKAWQFTGSGQLPGIQGDVDMNAFLGSADDLLACCMP